ncbi:MAG TPA: hypothetical protein VGV85_16170 [Longimicrobiaceae bacterium]|nr:hypothetical protein [Longimicrobiaceae bacterium]
MATQELRDRADRRFEEALKETGARDPRDFYRKRLKELREQDVDAFRRALAYFEERLIPAVAAEGSDAVAEWLEYGRFLAGLAARGTTLQVDPTGLAVPYAPPVPRDHLVIHLPDASGAKALVVGIPPELSPAQRATYDLLVSGSQG